MSKKSVYQLLIFIFLTTVAAATFFYFKDEIIKINLAEVINSSNLAENLPQVQKIAEQIKETTNLPEPLRLDSGTPNAWLTVDGVVLWTNQQRRLNGELGKLSPNSQLNAAAQAKLQDMFTNQYFAHYSPAGLGPSDFVDSAGYAYIETGENLALGNFADDQELVQAWMDSPGHRENILTPQFTEIGVAVGQGNFEGEQVWLAVQVFGRPTSDCPPVNESLRDNIEANQNILDGLKTQIEALKAELDNKPGPKASKEEYDAYNQKVNEYNSLAEQFNSLAQHLQSLIEQYNGQIEAFNSCAN